MIRFDDFEYNDNKPECEHEFSEALEDFISQNKRLLKTRRSIIQTEETSISGKRVKEIIESIMNNRFTIHKNTIDYQGRYITENLPNGKTRSVRNWDVEFTHENYPIVSGTVDVNGYFFQYVYIGASCVWALLKDGKRYVFHVIDAQPYNLSPSLKEGDGKCKFGAYNGRRFHKDLIMALELYVTKSIGNTDSMLPFDYEFVL